MNTPTPLDGPEVPCRANPEAMFPTSTHGQRALEDAAAKAVCRTGNNGKPCPVLDRCLRYSLRHDVDGIWAATTPDERQGIRERTGVVPIPVVATPYSMRHYEQRVNGAA